MFFIDFFYFIVKTPNTSLKIDYFLRKMSILSMSTF